MDDDRVGLTSFGGQVDARYAALHERGTQGHVLLTAERRVDAGQICCGLGEVEGRFAVANAQGALEAHPRLRQLEAVIESCFAAARLLIEDGPWKI